MDHHPPSNAALSNTLAPNQDTVFLDAVLTGLLDSSSHSSAIFDNNWKLLFCNKQFRALLEVQETADKDKSPLLETLRAELKSKPQNADLFDLQVNTTRGELPFLASLSPFILSANQSPGLILALHDLPDQAQRSDFLHEQSSHSMLVNNALKQMREYAKQAESANKAKGEFLTNMSHEIRTPLNAVLGTINLLLNTELSEQQRRYATISKNSGESLLRLLNDILDFSKIESGHLELEDIVFSLDDLLEGVAEIISHRLTKKRLQLVYFLEPGCPEFVQGDIGRVRQILVNLVGNAVKFTPAGSITISVSLEKENPSDYLLFFQVADTGIGIPEDKLAHLFAPFTQVDASTTRKFGGTGLGLSISKRLTNLMGGNIGVTSSEGHGSTFWFTLNLGKADRVSKTPVNLEGTALLVAPDYALDMPKVMLNSMGLAVLCASDIPAAARAIAESDNIRVMLADYDMGMNTIMELASLIEKKSMQTQMILLLPTLDFKDEADLLKNAGYEHILIKPVKKSEFLKAMGEETIGEEFTMPMNLSAEDGVDPGQFKLLLVEDNQINQLVALDLLKTMGYRTDVAANGQEAVAALAHIHYDLVLMDCQMPVMDGYETTALVRSGESPALDIAIPIIAMTANTMAGDKEKCFTVGMNDYISKPIIPAQLQQVLQKWLAQKRVTTTPTPQKNRLKPAWERFARPRS